MYTRQLKVYKGIDNVLEFRLLNADQKPINTSGYTPVISIFDQERNLIVKRDCVVLDDGSSATKGLFQVTVTDNDTLNLQQQFLTYAIHLVDADSNNIVTYSDTYFGNEATIFLSTEAYPGPRATYSVTTFIESGVGSGIYNSETLDAQPGINGNEALHTAAIYTSNYVGDVVVQATLDIQVTGTTAWADIDTITFSGTESEPTPVNFNGVYSFLRFKATSNPANKITKILVRN